MVSQPHEIVSRALSMHISSSIHHMGLGRTLFDSGSSRVTATTSTSTSVKEPYGSFTLARENWPSIAIETGLSEHATKLTLDAHWWLEVEGSRTLVVITAKIDQRSPRLIFQRWEHNQPALCPASQHYHLTCMIMQEVHAVHEGGMTRVPATSTYHSTRCFVVQGKGTWEKMLSSAETAWESLGFM